MSWAVGDIQLGMLFTRGRIEHGDPPLLYRVEGLVFDPMAILVPADPRDGMTREYIVIGSMLFEEFKRVELVNHEGVRDLAPVPEVAS